METGNVIRVVDVQRQDGVNKELLNVYHFFIQSSQQSVPMQVYVDDIAAKLNDWIISKAIGLQSSDIAHTEVRCYNLSAPDEQASHVWPTPIRGINPADSMPSFNAWSFKLLRYSASVRNGRKSFPGVADNALTSTKTLNPAYGPAIDNVEAALASPFTFNLPDFTAQWVHVIVRVPANPGVTPTVFTPVVAAQFRGFGSQNSRKVLSTPTI